jgi:hypothetical protein
VLALGFAASLPFVVAAIEAVSQGWVAYGDDAVIATRSFDVFSGNPPLVGQWSSGPAEVVGARAYTPGPLLYWLLSLPARFLPPAGMTATITLLNVACVMGSVGLAHRRGGNGLMLATAIAIPVMLASLPAQTYVDVWNPAVPLPPLLLLIFVAWSVACGEHRLLPLAALLVSFNIQTHLSYVAPTLAVAAVALVGLAAHRRHRAGAHDERLLKWLLLAGAVTVVCWIPPLIDEARNDPGNLAVLRAVVSSDEPTLGAAPALRAVVHTIGVPPWWLQESREPLERINDLSTRPGLGTIASALLVLMGLAAVLVIAGRRRQYDVAVAALLGLALCAAVAVNTASTPQRAFDTTYYTLRWASLAGMFSWLALGWSVSRLAPPPRWTARMAGAARITAALAALATGAVVAVSAAAPTEPYRAVEAATDSVTAALPAGTSIRVDAGAPLSGIVIAFNFEAGIAYSLRKEGHDVIAPAIAKLLGDAYADGRHDRVVRVDVDQPPPSANRVVARLSVRDTFESEDMPRHVVSVSLAPVERGTEGVRRALAALAPAGETSVGGSRRGSGGARGTRTAR